MASGLEDLAAKYEQAQHNAQKAMSLFKATREENEVRSRPKRAALLG
jgi:hypothetical protein